LPFDSDGERRRERITRSCGNREALPLDRLWKAEQIGSGKAIYRQKSAANATRKPSESRRTDYKLCSFEVTSHFPLDRLGELGHTPR